MAIKVQTEVTHWLVSFPAERVLARLNELEAARQLLEREMAELQGALEHYKRLSESFPAAARNDGTDLPPKLPEPQPARRYPAKRVVALNLLSEVGQPMELREIFDELVNRGQVGKTDSEYHALRVALYKAFQRGEVDRPNSRTYAHKAQRLEPMA